MAVVALGDVFQRFVEKSPISVMAGGLVERLLNPERLNELFKRSAISQYTRELLFSTMFDLMSEVVMGARRSVHAAYQASREEIGVSIASVYNKLDGIETEVSAALVRETGREVAAVIEEMGGQVPALLPGYRVKILDGNAIAATEHRLRELRSHSAGPLPGKSLVVLDPQMRAVIDVFPCEDGHAQERSLLGKVLERVEPRDVWIEDRNFCVLSFLFGIAGRGAYFVVRQHGQMPWEAAGPRRRV
ncbi:MAG: IS4/IS5 family transposase, partial [bacterium]